MNVDTEFSSVNIATLHFDYSRISMYMMYMDFFFSFFSGSKKVKSPEQRELLYKLHALY